ncbi:hypothetical protein [Kitasatospora sp. MBT66]|uniref:hypothetical protein n=1 Tax=Kitasatospora sp. MBT66 TaxID=1444769 RepID=UPI0005BDA2DE|nr:hypothetical protein [Kitasatospora sp. MBT66]
MFRSPPLRRSAAVLLAATALTLAAPMSAGTAHADDPQEYLCVEVVADGDALTQASGCVGGPTDYTGPATVTDFFTDRKWACEEITTETDPDQDDPDFSRITATSGCA